MVQERAIAQNHSSRIFRVGPLIIAMSLPALTENFHLKSYVSCDCSAPISASEAQHPTFHNVPLACTPANPSSRSSNRSIWYFRLHKRQSTILHHLFTEIDIPAQPVLKIRLSLAFSLVYSLNPGSLQQLRTSHQVHRRSLAAQQQHAPCPHSTY